MVLQAVQTQPPDAPIALGDGLRKPLLRLGNAKTAKQKLSALSTINPKDLLAFPKMVNHALAFQWANTKPSPHLEWNISRTDQDELAYNSHQNLAQAYESGFLMT